MKTKLILALVSLSLFVMYSCKKEKPKLEPSLGTSTTSGNNNPTSTPKTYTYTTAYVYKVKFYALSSNYYNDDIRFQVKNGAATLNQSSSERYYGTLPFIVDDYYASYYINTLSAQHTLYLDYYSSSSYFNFSTWNFTPQAYAPLPSTLSGKDTTISISNSGSTLFDVTLRFKGI